MPHDASRGATARPPVRDGIELRDVHVAPLAAVLRAMLGLPDDALPGIERIAWHGRAQPTVLHRVDVAAWVAWALSGLSLFVDGPPTLDRFRAEARRPVLVMAMRRAEGSITAAALALGTSRKVLRDGLRRRNLYPWPGGRDERDDGRSSPSDRRDDL